MISESLKLFIAVAVAVVVTGVTVFDVRAEERVALVIGNSSYENISSLANPKNDALLMTKTLQGLGFEVVSAVDANRTEMGRAIRKFGKALRSAGRDAVGLFYYAGHGVQSDGGNYLIPIGASIEDDADLEIEALSTSYILKQLERAGNRLNLMVLDACRNNPFKGRFRSSQRGLTRIESASGIMVAFSAGPGQAAQDGRGKNSPYTSALVDVMKKPGLKVEEVFKRVRIKVEKDTDGSQTPWEESSLRGEFYFSPATRPETVSVAPAPTPVPTVPNTVAAEPEGRNTWTAIQGTRSKAILRTFIEEYPASVYAKFARARLAELEQADAKNAPLPAVVVAEPEITPPKVVTRTETQNDDQRTNRSDDDTLIALADPEALVETDADPKLARKIQRALKQAGCDPGTVDGVWGNRSAAALEMFARDADLHLPAQQVSRDTLMLLLKSQGKFCLDGTVETAVNTTPSTTPSTQGQDYYGAIAYSQDTDAHGWAKDYSTQSEAERRALEECKKHGGGCEVVSWVRNACSVLAVGKGYGYGADWGDSRDEAERKALKLCSSNTSNCSVRRWICTTQ